MSVTPEKLAASGERRPRSMSFTSELMAVGSYFEWNRMIRPIINVALFVDDLPEERELLVLMEKLLGYHRFASVPTKMGRRWMWNPVDAVDPRAHIARARVADAGGVQEQINAAMMQPLRDLERPWWELLLVENTGPGESCVIFRVDHSIADGISLIQVMNETLVDEKTGAALDFSPFQRREKNFRPGCSCGLVAKTLAAVGRVIGISQGLADSPLSFIGSDVFKATFSGARRFVPMPDVPLAFVKDLKNAAGVTVNDVIFGVTAGVLRRYSAAVQDPMRPGCLHWGVRSRALVPVAFPRSAEETADRATCLHNKWCFVSARLPVHVAGGALERVRAAHDEMNVLKNSPTAYLTLGLQNGVLSKLPYMASRMTLVEVMRRHTIVFSNVPGPQTPTLFAQRRIKALQMVFPNMLPQVGCLSYNGSVNFNFVLDPAVVSRPDIITALYAAEFRQLADQLDVAAPAALAEAERAMDGLSTTDTDASARGAAPLQ